jgi:hypothetical protein
MTSMFRWYTAAQEKEQLATKVTRLKSATQNKDTSCEIWDIHSSDYEELWLFGCNTVRSGQHLQRFWRKLKFKKIIGSRSRRQYSSNWYQVGLQPNEHKILQKVSWGDKVLSSPGFHGCSINVQTVTLQSCLSVEQVGCHAFCSPRMLLFVWVGYIPHTHDLKICIIRS